MLLLLAPVLAAIAIAIRVDSPGPAIFRQRRVGRGRRPFTVMKFRTMYQGVAHDPHREFVIGLIKGESPTPDTESGESPGLYYKMIGDKRVTRVGRLLRRSSLDELPQLWNVLRGEMSLVGPRPPIPYEVEHYPPHWFARLDVKPGVTGLWQVSGRSQVTLEEMVQLDVDYVRRRSLRLNLCDSTEDGARRAGRARSMVMLIAISEHCDALSDRAARTFGDLLRCPCAPPRRPNRKTIAGRPQIRSCARTRCRAIRQPTGRSQGVGDPTIQGFATAMSVNVGADRVVQDQDDGERVPHRHPAVWATTVATVPGWSPRTSSRRRTLPQTQPECLHEPSTGLIDCGNWGVSAQWTVPSNAVSGVYIALLTRNDTGGAEPDHLRRAQRREPFEDPAADLRRHLGGVQRLRRQQPVHLHGRLPAGQPEGLQGRAFAVSYNRPFDGALHDRRRRLLSLVRRIPDDALPGKERLRRQLHERGRKSTATARCCSNHKIFISSGHDEYWSAGQRANVEAAREAGVNLAFFSGNEIFWKTRWGPSIDGSETPVPDADDLQGDALRRTGRPGGPADLDRRVARPALQPARRRRPARERALRPAVRGQLGDRRHHGALRSTASCGCGATPPWRALQPGPDTDARPRKPARSATSGTKTSTTASGPPASSTSPPRPSRRAGVHRLRHLADRTTRPPPTT